MEFGFNYIPKILKFVSKQFWQTEKFVFAYMKRSKYIDREKIDLMHP